MRPFLTMFVVLALASSGLAIPVQFSDRPTFEAAAAALSTETFNSFVADVPLGATTFDVGDFSITTTNPSSLLRIESSGADSFNVDGTAFVRGVGSTGDTFTFTFDSAITAFGVDLYALNDGIERSRVLIGGDTYFLPVVADNQNSFFGLTSDTPFSSVTFSTLTGEDGSFDNISYGDAVPEPGSLALMGLGVLGLGWYRRRRNQK